MFDGVVSQGTVSGCQESVSAVLRVVRQLPAQVGSDGSTEVDGAGLHEYFSPFLEADGHWRVDDLIRPLPVDCEDSEMLMFDRAERGERREERVA